MGCSMLLYVTWVLGVYGDENIVHGRYVCTNSFIGPDCQYYTNDASQYFSMDAIEDDILIGAKLNGTFIGSNYGLVPGAYSKYALHIRKTGYLNFGDVRYLGCFGGYLMECGTGFTMMFWLYVMDKNPIFKDPLCHSCYTAYYLGNGGHTIRSYGYAVFHQAGYIQMSVRHFLGVKNGTQRQIRVASRTHVGIGWVHVTATWNRQQGARLYTNGTLGIVAKDEDVPVNCSSTVNDYTIGALSEETYKRYPLIIDDLLFWDGVKNTEFLPNIWDYYQLA
ncbi:uncharacterized protein LOC141904402 [Tubulanus polymorphus]|uniref:uncharacterized protein LOC141904402 n=1 Tax=Tubulanus polymorphus TaxID=672921 RepID=UPI003DA517B4